MFCFVFLFLAPAEGRPEGGGVDKLSLCAEVGHRGEVMLRRSKDGRSEPGKVWVEDAPRFGRGRNPSDSASGSGRNKPRTLEFATA